MEEGIATHLSSCLENPMDIAAWQATADRAAKSWTRLRGLSTHACTHHPARPPPTVHSPTAPPFRFPPPPPLPHLLPHPHVPAPWQQGNLCGVGGGVGMEMQWRWLDCWMVCPRLAFHLEPALCNKEKCIVTVVCITIKGIFSPVHLSFFFLVATILR